MFYYFHNNSRIDYPIPYRISDHICLICLHTLCYSIHFGPYIENAYGMLYAFCPSPRKVSEIYTRVVSNYVDNLITITKLVNNAIFANLESSKILLQHRTECIKELSRIGVNTTRTFEHISTDSAAIVLRNVLFRYNTICKLLLIGFWKFWRKNDPRS
jgi:hypothetical protein